MREGEAHKRRPVICGEFGDPLISQFERIREALPPTRNPPTTRHSSITHDASDPNATRHFGSLVTGGGIRPWTPPSLPFTLAADAAIGSGDSINVVAQVQLAPLKATGAAHARAEG